MYVAASDFVSLGGDCMDLNLNTELKQWLEPFRKQQSEVRQMNPCPTEGDKAKISITLVIAKLLHSEGKNTSYFTTLGD